MASASAGAPWTLEGEFLNESSGVPLDAAGVTLDITYNGPVDVVPDVAGPYVYGGSSSPSSVQVYRTGVGQYAFIWPVPGGALTGTYTANWTFAYGGDEFYGVENFYVSGGTGQGGGVPVPSGDVGYWTGSLAYTPAAGTPASPVAVSFGTGPDDNGVAWLWNRIDGWDSPDVQGGGVIPKSGDHGGWSSPQFYAPRQLTLTVTASAPTQALRDVARATLQAAIPVSDLALLTYNEPIPKQALVRRSGKVTEAPPTLADVTFTCGLVAPDPRKYSTQLQTVTFDTAPSTPVGVTLPAAVPWVLASSQPGGSAAVTNAGTFETRPLITITGPITSPSLTNVTTGQTVSWAGLVVPAGQQFTADFSLMQATLGGAYRAADPFSSWWTLPPGTSTIQASGQSDAGASVAIAWSSAWM